MLWRLGYLLGGLAVASWLFKWWVFSNPTITPDTWAVYYSLPARLDAPALGMLLAVVMLANGDRPVLSVTMARLLRPLGLAALVAAVLLAGNNPSAFLFHTSLISAAALLLISATILAPRGSQWEGFMGRPMLQFLGTISYGLYLLHEPILIELWRWVGPALSAPTALPLGIVVLLTLVIGAATLAHYMIERPFNELRHLFDTRGLLIQRYTVPSPVALNQQAAMEPLFVEEPPLLERSVGG